MLFIKTYIKTKTNTKYWPSHFSSAFSSFHQHADPCWHFQFIILPLQSALGQYVISENSLVVVCLCSLPLHFVDWWHQQTHMSQTQDFLAIEAKWNIVCPGPQPSLPLGLWPRWTVIKQGCAESALHISMPPHSIYFFIYAALWQVFPQRRSQPYACFRIHISWCV